MHNIKPEEKLERTVNSPHLLTQRGSKLYGTEVENSDDDYMGFTTPPIEYLKRLYNSGGGRYNFEQKVTQEGDYDSCVYSTEKFLKLTLKGNTHCIEALFAPKDSIVEADSLGWAFIGTRNSLISKQIYHCYRGFAQSEYRKAMGDTTGNLGKQMLEKHGYCTKNAYHALRLLDQGNELLSKGHLTFPRPDAEFLLEVRSGSFTKGDIKAFFGERDRILDAAFEHSPLPDKPNYRAVNRLLNMSWDMKTG
jgi:predicted nucleotidyltransferase